MYTNTDLQIRKYKRNQDVDADTSSARKMKCANAQTEAKNLYIIYCRVENTNMKGNMNEKIQIHY